MTARVIQEAKDTVANLTGRTGELAIVTTCTVHAAREAVWNAWTNPILLAQWWGPKGFRNTFYEFDLRPGGAEDAVDLFRLLPHARLAVLPGTDHMALMMRAAWLAPMVGEFLDTMPKIEKPEALAV